MNDTKDSVWTSKDIHDLPDSSFAYIEPGGSKDSVGKTVPRILRHFPVKNASGTLIAEAITKALGDVETAPLSKRVLERVKAKLLGMQTAKAAEPEPEHDLPCGCGDEHCSGTKFLAGKTITKTEDIEKYITHEGGKWQVHSEAGKVLGTHDSKAEAVAQLGAIEANKHPKEKGEGTVKWPVDDSRFQGSSLVGAGEKAPNQKTEKMVDTLKTKEPGSRVQTLIFDKTKYEKPKDAKAWASDHGFSSGKVDETGESYRLRQADPGGFERMRTIALTEGVSAVIGFPKTAIKAVQDAFFTTTTGRLAFKSADLETAECEPIAESEDGTIFRVKIADYTLHFAEQNGEAVHLPFYGAFSKSEDAFVPVFKAEEQRYTLSVVYPASKKGVPEPDFHGDVMSEEELEKSAWGFMGKGTDRIGLMHRPGTHGAGKVVESYIWRGPEWKMKDAGGKEQSVSPGDWVMGIVWEPAAWQAIKSGQITGLSLQGAARKEAVR